MQNSNATRFQDSTKRAGHLVLLNRGAWFITQTIVGQENYRRFVSGKQEHKENTFE